MNPPPHDSSIVSLQVGLPKEIWQAESGDSEKAWTTGFHKQRVDGPVWLSALNLAGDGQADLVHHGGANKAVCAYSADHYPFWHRELGRVEMQHGAFGENLTIAGLTEKDVCIGDTWSIGEVLVQVSQPRQPCWKLARRWNIKDLALQVQQTGRTGWYFRVLREGYIASGMRITLVERPFSEWTVATANHIMHHDKQNFADAMRLASISLLSSNWQESLLRRVHKNNESDALRLNGPDASDTNIV
ncbi:MAG TPA: MOSC domain-containing protein [Pirellulaceae bacterium]|nr:MOSC domain-containing protein [Planctomycetales bacterium]MCB9941272.1 MOSC domain-containing protein [Planctomycetaceae bacterium]HRX82534.1 MOSC domain-containing protein [Pirellulaceae bacterium]